VTATASLSSPPSPRLATPRQGFADLLTQDCALAFQFPNDNPSDRMAAGGLGQFALQFRNEALCTGKNAVPAASFESQRRLLAGLGTAAPRACAGGSHARGASFQNEAGRARAFPLASGLVVRLAYCSYQLLLTFKTNAHFRISR